MSNVRELRKNLVDKVCELGVGSAFVSHPAFIPALSPSNRPIMGKS